MVLFLLVVFIFGFAVGYFVCLLLQERKKSSSSNKFSSSSSKSEDEVDVAKLSLKTKSKSSSKVTLVEDVISPRRNLKDAERTMTNLVEGNMVESTRGQGSILQRKDFTKSSEDTFLLKRGKTMDQMNKLMRLKNSGNRKSSQPDAFESSFESHPIYCPPIKAFSVEEEDKIMDLKMRLKDDMIDYFSDRQTYIRFLVARQWNVENAEMMLRDAITWRKNLEPLDERIRNAISFTLASGVLYMLDESDKYGRPVVYVCARRFNPKQRDPEVALRVLVWLMDRFWNEAKNTHYKKFVMLVNYKGMGMRCVDLNLIMSFLPVLQNCYPEVCQRIILADAPFFLYGLWKVIKPLLDVETQNKISFVNHDEILEHFSPECVPVEIGGAWNEEPPAIDIWAKDVDYTKHIASENEEILENGVYNKLD